jgi:hypothetical protein
VPGAFVSRPSSSARVMHMHRFTEPTPTTLIGKDLIQVVVASWEIQCGCSPLPTIGHPSTWVLMFVTEPNLAAAVVRDSDWQVGDPCGSDVALVSGAVTAYWPASNGPDPALGTARLRGCLLGTVHGGQVPQDFPSVTGVVQRIRLMSQRFVHREQDGYPTAEPVPRTQSLTELDQCPRWFDFHQPAPEDSPDNPLSQTGVLLDLTVDRPETGHDVGKGHGA